MPYKDPVKKAEYHKKWAKENPEKIAANFKKSHDVSKIYSWKKQGMICNDWEFMYSIFMWWNYCDFCGKVFTKSKDKHLEHNHFIKDRENIRGICCGKCNEQLKHQDKKRERN